MLICLFAAFLFFVVRLPAYDQRNIDDKNSNAETPLILTAKTTTFHTETTTFQTEMSFKPAVLHFESETEERQAA